jgi:hypothetical protein
LASVDLHSAQQLVRSLESHVARQRHIAESTSNDDDRRSALGVLHLLEETLAMQQDRVEALERLNSRH